MQKIGLSISLVIILLLGHTASAITHYVKVGNLTPVAPYTSWETAATNIQDAVDACSDADSVIVTNGVYNTGGTYGLGNRFLSRVAIMDAEIVLTSVNGPELTIIEGSPDSGTNAIRGVYMNNNSLVSGFTVRNGNIGRIGIKPSDNAGGGVAIEQNGTISNCFITANYGSAVLMYKGGAIYDSFITNNPSRGIITSGGGFAAGCRILNNQDQLAGGVWLVNGELRNCFISGNLAKNYNTGTGGGVAISGNGAKLVNCTIVNNTANVQAGGLYVGGGTIINTIVYGNNAPTDPDYHVTALALASSPFYYNCLAPEPSLGEGNITNAPLLGGISNYYLVASSPCIAAGSTNYLENSDRDIDNQPRITDDHVDIGCAQFVATNSSGPLTVNINLPYGSNVIANYALPLGADISGKVLTYEWQITTPAGTTTQTNSWKINQTWTNSGTYLVTLTATNRDQQQTAAAAISVTFGFTNYVSTNGSAVYPYADWATAATDLWTAISVAYAGGGIVLVSNGCYALPSEITLDRPVVVRGYSDSASVKFDGGGTQRCFTVNHTDAILQNLTIQNGSADAGGGVKIAAGLVTDCSITNNYASIEGGGAIVLNQGQISNCYVAGNTADKWSGGIAGQNAGTIDNCTIYDNYAIITGGGAQIINDSQIRNCFISRNHCDTLGGGLALGSPYASHCTISQNTCDNQGGGLYMFSGAIINSIIYDNSAAVGDNYYLEISTTPKELNYCCTTPELGEGIGNITNEPKFVGIYNPHLADLSPCRGAGLTNGISSDARDIDGEPRFYEGLTDIGCDEYIGTNILGPLTASINCITQGFARHTIKINGEVTGKAFANRWTIETDNSGLLVLTNETMVTHSWDNPGSYLITLSASNLTDWVSTTTTVQVLSGRLTNYVSQTGSHVYPFTNWATAATNIQAAIDACIDGGAVLVATGTYYEATELNIAKSISVSGNGEKEDTIIDAQYRHRVATVTEDSAALLAKMTFTRGSNSQYGGILLMDGMVSNCVIRDCIGQTLCGGIQCRGGTVLYDSDIINNYSFNWPGGVYLAGNAQVILCDIKDNVSGNRGGGVYLDQGGSLEGCLIRGNSSLKGGGIYFEADGGNAYLCVLYSNAANAGAGAYFDAGGTIDYAVAVDNWAISDGGGYYFSGGGTATHCIAFGNHADTYLGSGGGFLFNGGGVATKCIAISNDASRGAGVYGQTDGELNNSIVTENHAIYEDGGNGVGGGIYFYEGCISKNTIVYGNYADGDGAGAVGVNGGTFINCTIADNTASNNGGGLYLYGSGYQAVNCIIYTNTATTNANYVIDDTSAISFCCTEPLIASSGNISNNPLFVSVPDQDFRLQNISPCIDHGTNQNWMTNSTDLAGNTRIINGTVDMGAYEYLTSPSGLSTSSGLFNKVTICWQGVPGAQSYEIWRSPISNESPSIITSGITNLCYDDTTVRQRTAFYWVRANYGEESSPLENYVIGYAKIAYINPWLMLLSPSNGVQ